MASTFVAPDYTPDNVAANKSNATTTFNDHAAHHNKLADAINATQAATGLLLTGGVGAPNTRTVSYTLALADGDGVIEMNSSAATTVTVPPNATVAFAPGASIEVVRWGTGAVTIAGGSGVTIRSRGNLLAVGNQYSSVTLRKRATNEWHLVGDLA